MQAFKIFSSHTFFSFHYFSMGTFFDLHCGLCCFFPKMLVLMDQINSLCCPLLSLQHSYLISNQRWQHSLKTCSYVLIMIFFAMFIILIFLIHLDLHFFKTTCSCLAQFQSTADFTGSDLPLEDQWCSLFKLRIRSLYIEDLSKITVEHQLNAATDLCAQRWG